VIAYSRIDDSAKAGRGPAAHASTAASGSSTSRTSCCSGFLAQVAWVSIAGDTPALIEEMEMRLRAESLSGHP